jgi:hypothetical protein|tara:strand:- start:4438 stop:5181 length:744 start_codon:yes stop_codon:yes gene_type:complete
MTKKALMDALVGAAGAGLEEVGATDVQTPYLRIAQALSPQLKKSGSDYIEGLDQGDIFNTVTKQFWKADEGVTVLPIYFQLKYNEWVPRSEGGGFVKEHPHDSPDVLAMEQSKDSVMQTGNELIKTATHLVKVMHENGTLENAILDMKGSNLKRSRGWNSLMSMQRHDGVLLPSYAKTYKVKTNEVSGDQGSWFEYVVTLDGEIESLEQFTEADELRKEMVEGSVQLAPPTEDKALSAPAEQADVPF